ncbi:hypothetical protein KAI56_04915 [Candidatus Parcubacteria bacterium]|nr:hypothetical protein [Candidatus Parcubacteria bacterium]
MKKHSSKKCSKNKTGFRTPSVFRGSVERKNKSSCHSRGGGNPVKLNK